MPVTINGRQYCEYCKAVCLTCPGNRGHESICRMNPKNVKAKLPVKKKSKSGKLEIAPEWEGKDLSRLDLNKPNKPIYFDSHGNPFN
jgi:hypothetical protein